MSKENVVIKDPLYKMILVEKKHKHIIDSPEFQRLRNIAQTAFASYVYPSANHTRFSHSLGCYHVMKKTLNNNLINLPKLEKDKLVIAALLHDVGHGPFSHLWERVFPHFDHDEVRLEILDKMGLRDVKKVLEGDHPFYSLLSSTLDVDKLDYMARDSYSCGVSYGMLEVDYIVQHINVIDGKLVIKPSSLSSVEDLITQRINLFKVVYYHKNVVAFDFIFRKAFERVKELIKTREDIFLFDSLRAFFNKTNTVDDLLSLNDHIIYAHIEQWSKDKDPILSDLAKRILRRDKFKVINLEHSKVNVDKIKKAVAKKYDVNYYFNEEELPIKLLQAPIYVDIKGKVKKLEEVSDLVKHYKKHSASVKLVMFPRDVEII